MTVEGGGPRHTLPFRQASTSQVELMENPHGISLQDDVLFLIPGTLLMLMLCSSRIFKMRIQTRLGLASVGIRECVVHSFPHHFSPPGRLTEHRLGFPRPELGFE